MAGHELIKIDEIKSRIFTIRGMQVMLDSDLAELYGVETKRLNEQVRRNIERFPDEFSFVLSRSEYDFLRSHFATLEKGQGKKFNHSHDRFMIIDDKDLYHFGASLKDLGKKWFGFSKMDVEVTKMLARI